MERHDVSTETQGGLSLLCEQEGGNELIVFNDDFHTFDYVIDCLQHICRLNRQQAVNCTNVIHYKGLCAVKHGSYDELKQMCSELLKKELSAEVR